MPGVVVGLSVTSIVFCGAIFGFFYAWVCSTMWGLDQTDPRVTIVATSGSISAKMFSGKPLERRFTNIYIWSDARWRLLARHANVIHSGLG
ncbi:hypothetical protein MES5069_60169 [Mesorhizobium escarrei]|uniref:Uncharacterized protein n=1 Tax=Mesorhizobium escarrei TaxID=666018 RepID=A0ABM9EE52_9HYPH|nr:hypothetical protein MES5069_60169 [Mesorhizobium escarrei]